MDVVGVMAAYLPVVRACVCVCTAQSREARWIIKCFNVNDAQYKHDSSTHLAEPSKSRHIHVILYHLVTLQFRGTSSPAAGILWRISSFHVKRGSTIRKYQPALP